METTRLYNTTQLERILAIVLEVFGLSNCWDKTNILYCGFENGKLMGSDLKPSDIFFFFLANLLIYSK